jgi:hypothetical protein
VSQQTEDEADEDVLHPEPEAAEDEPAELDALPPHSRKEQRAQS